MQGFLNLLQLNDTLVYFAYGQVFFSLGLAIALHSRRHSHLDLARQLSWLAAFGLSHGLYEWAHVFIPIQATYLPASSIEMLNAGRIALLALSFFFLGQFGALVGLPATRLRHGASLYFGALLLVYLVWSATLAVGAEASTFVQAEVWARRAIGLPSSALAALGMFREARNVAGTGLRTIARDFRIAALSFGAYAFVAGLVPIPDPLVAPWPIYHLKVDFLFLPAPVVRSVAGMGVVFGIVRGLRIFEIETDRRLEEAERARLQALERARSDLEKEVARKEMARAQLLRKVITAQEEERRRVARELHDETGQSLTALIMALGATRERVANGPQKVVAMLDEAREVAVRALDGTREIIMGLRPASLDDLGLVPTLRRFTEDLARKGRLEIALEANGNIRRMPGDVEVVLFRILQESLHNVLRHSQARRATVRLVAMDGEMRAEVTDDGVGFDLEEAMARPETGRGLGLLGMRERAGLLGGKVKVETAPGRGTRVLVRIPLPEEDGRNARTDS